MMKKIARRVVTLDLFQVDPNPNQPRSDAENAKIAGLATSIDEQGLEHHILVRPQPDNPSRYQIIAGERRYHALCKLYREGRAERQQEFMLYEGGSDAFLLSVVENKNRLDLNAIDEAKTIDRLRGPEYRLGWKEIADLMGEAEDTVQNRRRLLKAPQEIQDMIATGTLPSYHLANLMRDTNKARMIKIAHDLIEGKEAPDFHFRETTARGKEYVQRQMPKTPQEFASRLVRYVGSVQNLPMIVMAFMQIPKEDRQKALDEIDPSVRGKIRVTIQGVTSAMRMLATELGVQLSADERKGDATPGGTTETLPQVSYHEALWVLRKVVSGGKTQLTVDLSKASLAEKLGKNGTSTEPLVISTFRFVSLRWGKDVPKGVSPAKEFMVFIDELRRKIGSPGFRRALVVIRDADHSRDRIDITRA